MYSWGLNFWGQLGQGHCEEVRQPTRVKEFNKTFKKQDSILFDDEYIHTISCGSVHTLIISNKGRIFSTGYGETYALGHGTNHSLDIFKGTSTYIA